MALFGYLFDTEYKRKVLWDRAQYAETESPPTLYDPGDERLALLRLREDLGRVMLLNRVLIRTLIEKGTLSLEELTEVAREIDEEEDSRKQRGPDPPDSHKVMVCHTCGRPNFRFRTSCVYCGSLQY